MGLLFVCVFRSRMVLLLLSFKRTHNCLPSGLAIVLQVVLLLSFKRSHNCLLSLQSITVSLCHRLIRTSNPVPIPRRQLGVRFKSNGAAVYSGPIGHSRNE